MCGINGIHYYDRDRNAERSVVESMNQAVIHRGPDDGDCYLDRHVAIGHRRLSIIDVSLGHQPMCNEDGTVWITYNGEIYNYAGLREELLRKGHAFKTTSDTEVIVHLYEEMGEACVQRLHGMFAFAIWDRRTETLFLARDRVGIKPLYYWSGKDAFAFSSEIRGILQVPGVSRRLNHRALHDYLTFRYPVAPQTMFDGILKLPAGHTLTVRGRTCELRQYWDLDYSDKIGMDDSDCVDEFRRRLIACTQSHLVGEVPLGVLLSGGLDSTVVTGIVSELTANPVKTFSVAFGDDGGEFDERHYARLAARYYNTEHHEIAITHRDFVNGLADYVCSMEEPMADAASIPLYYVAKLASQYVTIILSGEGSDELLAGYGVNFKGIRRAERIRRIPPAIRNGLMKPLNERFLDSPRIARYLNLAERPMSDYPQIVPTYMGGIFSQDAKLAIYGRVMRDLAAAAGESEHVVVDLYRRTGAFEYVDQVLYVYSKHWLPDDLLLKADKMTMAHSLELRVPFLDHELVEFAARLPVAMKIRPDRRNGYVAKYVLRRAFAARVPTAILERQKLGFPVPLKQMFRRELGRVAADVFESRTLKESGLFDVSLISARLREHQSGAADYSQQLWTLLVFAVWLEAFRVQA